MITEIIKLTFTEIGELFSIYTDLEDLERSSDIYTFVALMVVIYSSFINYPILTFRIIINMQMMDKMHHYSQLLNQTRFFSTYLTKVNYS